MVPAPKKKWSWPTFEGLEAAGGSWGGQRPSGTTRDQCCGQKEPFEPKKIQPRPAFDGLEAAGGFWGGRTPSGIDTGFKRSHLSKKKFDLGPLEATLGRNLGSLSDF